ncbi:hypothetical protein [Microvirga arsenatis]|uniref:Uncharacterized protein n=1 Tax=Microvirga arsenatis TaxID=2692265 RepID=A0ABW9YY61_9HYPH|nr:hypothetical protein [Microvirga arsenatis]NBJ13237.1 hypothetical protein [Microvirga arsenatis]NBJ25125.1 hypothetical protein [Microvirga arsenatis]
MPDLLRLVPVLPVDVVETLVGYLLGGGRTVLAAAGLFSWLYPYKVSEDSDG